jgi:hypothetical protein
MNCPYCQKELPGGYGITPCPFCGREIYFEHIPIPPNRLRINWLVFYIVLFAPTVFNLVGALTNNGFIIFGSTFGGSVVAGIICASMLARYREMRGWLKVMLAFALVMTSFILCFIGCAFSVRFNHHR